MLLIQDFYPLLCNLFSNYLPKSIIHIIMSCSRERYLKYASTVVMIILQHSRCAAKYSTLSITQVNPLFFRRISSSVRRHLDESVPILSRLRWERLFEALSFSTLNNETFQISWTAQVYIVSFGTCSTCTGDFPSTSKTFPST
jgi:hypothetical protein